MKKFLSLFLASLIVVSNIPVISFAEKAEISSSLVNTVINDDYLVENNEIIEISTDDTKGENDDINSVLTEGDEAVQNSENEEENDDNYNPDDWIDDDLFHNDGKISLLSATTVGTNRYTVLTLDVSGSMSGTQMTKMKEAAINFCDTIINSRGNNYVAIVKFGSSASIACGFSNNLSSLTSSINSLSASGGTNTSGGLSTAMSLYEQLGASNTTERNVILISDGAPDSADAARNVFNSMKDDYNVYTMGYMLSSSYASFMSSIQNSGFYNVSNTNDILNAINEISSKILEGASGNLQGFLTNQTILKVYENKKSPSAAISDWVLSDKATVTVGGNSYTTTNGIVKFPTVTSGMVTVEKNGYITQSVNVAVVNNCKEIYLEKDVGDDPIIKSVIVNNVNVLYTEYEIDLKSTDQLTFVADVLYKKGVKSSLYLFQDGVKLDFSGDSLTTVIKDYFDVSKPIYIVATDTYGNQTKKELKMSTAGGVTDKLEDFKISMNGDMSFKLPESMGLFAGSTISVGINSALFELIPIEIATEENKVYISIGIDVVGYTNSDNYATSVASGNRAHVLKSETKTAYSRIKDLFDSSKKETSDISKSVKKLKNIKSTYGQAIKYPKGSLGFDADFTFLGFGEGYINSDGKFEWITGGIVLVPEVSASLGGQFAIGPVPMYWEWTIGAEIEARLNLYQNAAAKSFTPDGEISGSLSSSLGAGAGIKKVASIGGGITGSLLPFWKIRLNAEDYFRLDAKLNGYFKVTFLGFEYKYDTKKLKLEGTWIEHPSSKSAVSTFSTNNEVFDIYDESNYQIVDRSYISEPSEFLGNRVALFSETPERTLKTNVYTYSTPKTIEINDNSYVIVWIDDAAERTSVNKTAIYYVYCKDGVYTEPQIVYDDGTADYYPEIEKIGNNVYLTWNNSKTIYEDDANLESIMSELEVSVAMFDEEQGIFTDVSNITNNEATDISPILFGDDSAVYCAWIHNDQNDIDSYDGYSIEVSQYEEGGWSEPSTVINDAYSIESMDGCTYIDEDGTRCVDIYYSMDSDGDINTVDDLDIFVNGECIPVSSSGVDSNVTLKDKTLYWYSDGSIRYLNMYDSIEGYVTNDAVSDKFKVYKAENGDIYVTENIYEGVYSDIYAYRYDSNLGLWGNRSQITDYDKDISSYDVLMKQSGEIQLVINATEILENTDDNIFGQTDLVMYTVDQHNEIYVSDVEYNEEYVVEGNEVEVLVTVKNQGLCSACFKVMLTDESEGNVLSETESTVTLAPSSEIQIPMIFMVDELTADSTLKVKFISNDTVQLMSNDTTEVNNNYQDYEFEFTYSDISVENLKYGMIDNGFVNITADIVCRGYDYGEVEVSLREDSADGTVVDSCTVELDTLLDTKEVNFEVPLENEKVYYLTVDTDDMMSANNSDYVYLAEYNYEIVDEAVTITNCNNYEETVINIPSEVNNYPVTTIGSSAYEGCTAAETIVIPDTVTKIGYRAFAYCDSLESITIPANVTEIEESVFKGCTSLKEIIVDEQNTTYKSIDGVLYKAEENSLVIVYCPQGKTGVYTAPANVCGILEYAFENSSLTEIVLPENMEYIKSYAFKNAAIESLIVGDYIESIENSILMGCNSIEKLQMPYIGENYAAGRNIGWLFGTEDYYDNESYVPETLTYVSLTQNNATTGNYAFYACSNIQHLELNNSVIGNSVADSCTGLLRVKVGDNVTEIGEKSFRDCKSLVKVELGSNVTYIGSYAFSNCTKLTTIEIPEYVTQIDEGTFSGCTRLKNIKFPSNLEYIEDFAFLNCSSISNIELPDSVNIIGNYAFQSCSNLENIKLSDNLKYIYDYAFSQCKRLKNIELHNNIGYIGRYAFNECENLTHISIPQNVTTIHNGVFSGCVNLESVDMHNGINHIGSYVFAYCRNLSDIKLPDNLLYILESTFYECKSLKNIEIPETVGYIDSHAFYGCDRLSRITLTNATTYIYYNAFSMCTGLEDIYYYGTENDWNNVNISSGNTELTEADIHFINTTHDDTTRFMYLQTPVSDENFYEYDMFNYYSTRGYLVPAIKQGFIPCDMAFWKEKNKILIAGYFDNNNPSAILMLDEETGEYIGEYSLRNDNGYIYDKITGVESKGEYVYITVGNSIGRIPVSQFSQAKKDVKCDKYYNTPFGYSNAGQYDGRIDYLSIDGNTLWVGNTYTPENGNKAVDADNLQVDSMIVGYKLDSNNGKIISAIPDKAYIVPETNIKDIAIKDGLCVVAVSSDIKNDSNLIAYEIKDNQEAVGIIPYNSSYIGIYKLNKNNKTASLPPLVSGICIDDNGKFDLLFSSSANHYSDDTDKCTDNIWKVDCDILSSDNNTSDNDYDSIVYEVAINMLSKKIYDEDFEYVNGVIIEPVSVNDFINSEMFEDSEITDTITESKFLKDVAGNSVITAYKKDELSGFYAVKYESPYGVDIVFGNVNESQHQYIDYARCKKMAEDFCEEAVDDGNGFFVSGDNAGAYLATHIAILYGCNLLCFNNCPQDIVFESLRNACVDGKFKYEGLSNGLQCVIAEDEFNESQQNTFMRQIVCERNEAVTDIKTLYSYLSFDEGMYTFNIVYEQYPNIQPIENADILTGTYYSERIAAKDGITKYFLGYGYDNFYGAETNASSTIISGSNDKVIFGGSGNNDYYFNCDFSYYSYDSNVIEIIDATGNDTIHVNVDLDTISITENELLTELYIPYEKSSTYIILNNNRATPFTVTNGKESITVGGDSDEGENAENGLFSVVLPAGTYARVYYDNGELFKDYNAGSISEEYTNGYCYMLDENCIASIDEYNNNPQIVLNFVREPYKVEIERDSSKIESATEITEPGTVVYGRSDEEANNYNSKMFYFTPQKDGFHTIEALGRIDSIAVYDENLNEITAIGYYEPGDLSIELKKGKTYYFEITSFNTAYDYFGMVINEGYMNLYSNDIKLSLGENNLTLPEHLGADVYKFTADYEGLYSIYSDAMLSVRNEIGNGCESHYLSAGETVYISIFDSYSSDIYLEIYLEDIIALDEEYYLADYDRCLFSTKNMSDGWYYINADYLNIYSNDDDIYYYDERIVYLPGDKIYYINCDENQYFTISKLENLDTADITETIEADVEFEVSSNGSMYKFIPEVTGAYGVANEDTVWYEIYDDKGMLLCSGELSDAILLEGYTYYLLVASDVAVTTEIELLQEIEVWNGEEITIQCGNDMVETRFFVPEKTGMYTINHISENGYHGEHRYYVTDYNKQYGVASGYYSEEFMLQAGNVYAIECYSRYCEEGTMSIELEHKEFRDIEAEETVNEVTKNEIFRFTPTETGLYHLNFDFSKDYMYISAPNHEKYKQVGDTTYMLMAGETYYVTVYEFADTNYSELEFSVEKGWGVISYNVIETIEEGTTYEVTVENSYIESPADLKLYKFIPEDDGIYTITTDVGIAIMNENGIPSDMYGYESNCNVYLQGGKTYYINTYENYQGKLTGLLTISCYTGELRIFDSNNTYFNNDINIGVMDKVVINGIDDVKYLSSDGVESNITMKNETKVENITIKNGDIVLKVGESVPVLAEITPDNAHNQSVIWDVQDKSVASVFYEDGKYVLYAVGEGSTVLTAKSSDGSNILASVDVEVTQEPAPEYMLREDDGSGDSRITVSVEIPTNFDTVYINGKQATTYTIEENRNCDIIFFAENSSTGERTKSERLSLNIDTNLPIITGVVDGQEYYIDRYINVIDINLASVTVNGKEVEDINKKIHIYSVGDYSIEATDAQGNKTSVNFTIKEIPSKENITAELYSKILREYEEVAYQLTVERNSWLKTIIEAFKQSLIEQSPWYVSEIYYDRGLCYIDVTNFLDDYSILPTMYIRKYDNDGNLLEENIKYVSDALEKYIIADNLSGVAKLSVVLSDDDGKPLFEEKLMCFEEQSEDCIVRMVDGGKIMGFVSAEEFQTYQPEKEGYLFEGWYLDGWFATKLESTNVSQNLTVYARFVPENEPIKFISIDTYTSSDNMGCIDINYEYIVFDGVIVMAVYDGEVLVDTMYEDIAPGKKTTQFSFEPKELDKEYDIRIFYWNSIEEQKPYIPRIEERYYPSYQIVIDTVLESDHPYGDNIDDINEYVYEGRCKSIDVTFSTDTNVENNYDKILIYGANDNLIGEFTSNQLAGVTINIPGNTVRIRLKTDGSVKRYGYRTTSIVVNK